jgi:hypothetical protein
MFIKSLHASKFQTCWCAAQQSGAGPSELLIMALDK